MEKKMKHFSFTNFILAITCILVVIVLTTPKMSGYSENSEQFKGDPKDLDTILVLEYQISNLVDDGKIQLNNSLSREVLTYELKKFNKSIPSANNTKNKFYLNVKTGKVFSKEKQDDNDILIQY